MKALRTCKREILSPVQCILTYNMTLGNHGSSVVMDSNLFQYMPIEIKHQVKYKIKMNNIFQKNHSSLIVMIV